MADPQQVVTLGAAVAAFLASASHWYVTHFKANSRSRIEQKYLRDITERLEEIFEANQQTTQEVALIKMTILGYDSESGIASDVKELRRGNHAIRGDMQQMELRLTQVEMRLEKFDALQIHMERQHEIIKQLTTRAD